MFSNSRSPTKIFDVTLWSGIDSSAGNTSRRALAPVRAAELWVIAVEVEREFHREPIRCRPES